MAANSAQFYSDFRNDFAFSPFTGDLILLTNEKAVVQAVKNLVQTSWYERHVDVKFGGNVYRALFENPSSIVLDDISSNLKNAITNGEPRASNVKVNINLNDNSFFANITFEVQNIEAPISTSVLLQRLR